MLEGESLGSRLQRGALPSSKAVVYARQIAEGLGAAHDKGIVHRDLKPDNLFITSDDRIKILDFGIAKLSSPDSDASRPTGFPTETAEGVVVGTAGYMSPEQLRGEPVDARSDIFSFGAVLYEMLAGSSAFMRKTGVETMAAILKEDPAPLGASVPPALARIVSRCLESRARRGSSRLAIRRSASRCCRASIRPPPESPRASIGRTGFGIARCRGVWRRSSCSRWSRRSRGVSGPVPRHSK